MAIRKNAKRIPGNDTIAFWSELDVLLRINTSLNNYHNHQCVVLMLQKLHQNIVGENHKNI